jgi:hypothetical protein
MNNKLETMTPNSLHLSPHKSQSSVLSTQSISNAVSPLELLNLYYSDGQSSGNKQNKLWRKMNALLTWDNILNKGYQTDLCPLLYFIITKELPNFSGKLIANSILPQLKVHYNSSLVRNMILLDELKRVVNKLKENNIKVLILKGADLAESTYPDIALRPMGDIDLLVRINDLRKAENILNELGYNKNKHCNLSEHSFHDRYGKTISNQFLSLEIHHDIVRPIFSTQFNMNELWKESILNESGGSRLSLIHSLLYLCWHGSRHGLERLIWICDLAQIIKTNIGNINFHLIINKSIQWKILNPVLLCMNITRILLNINENALSKPIKKQIVLHKIYNRIILKIQINNQKKKESRDIINILSWLLIQDSKDKFMHANNRRLEIKNASNIGGT